MSATHRVLVKVQTAAGWLERGTVTAYDGPPNWKFEPLDADAREEWAATYAEPERVEETNRIAYGGAMEEGGELPAGYIHPPVQALPFSGFAAATAGR